MTKQKSYIVGITGGSGSGKTYLLNKLKEVLPKNKVTYISQDDYYLPKDQLEKDKNGVVNFDHPDCIDHQQLGRDIEKLKSGKAVEIKEYTFNNPSAEPVVITLHPAPIIIVEGIFCLYLKEVTSQLNLKVFVDANETVMLERRVKRDADERGYDRNDVLYRYKNHVLPAYQKFTKPFKDIADIIVDNKEENGVTQAVKAVSGHLNKFL